MISTQDTISNISLIRSQRYKKAQIVLRRLKSILIKKYGVEKIILIGSCAEPERFGFHSDIDLCIKGLSQALYFEALGELLIEAGDFNIDLIPFEDAAPSMKQKIKHGKLIYEKRRNIPKKIKSRNSIRA